MKSDIIELTNHSDRMDRALGALEQITSHDNLSEEDKQQLRLLSKEMISLVTSVTGELEGEFWLEKEGAEYQLHFSTLTQMTTEKRRQLLDASSSGKNAGRTGILGKIVEVFECYIEGFRSEGVPSYYTQGLILSEQSPNDNDVRTQSDAITWSLNQYKKVLTDSYTKGDPNWDELEKSILSKMADEVSVSIRSGIVEVIITKRITS